MDLVEMVILACQPIFRELILAIRKVGMFCRIILPFINW